MHDITVIYDINCHDANICYNKEATLPITVSISKPLFFPFLLFTSSSQIGKRPDHLLQQDTQLIEDDSSYPGASAPRDNWEFLQSPSHLHTPWLLILS